MTTRLSLESSVMTAMGKVLGLPVGRVTLNDDFIRLGGNSLQAAQLASALQGAYQALKITAQDVLRCQTASVLADFIRRQGIG